MELYLDSTDPKEILEVRSWGLISGVTTNPGLMSKAGPDMQKTLRGVLDASPGSVFCQAVGWHERETLMGQARWLHAFSDRIIVKLPMSNAGIQALLGLKQETSGHPDSDHGGVFGCPGLPGRESRRGHRRYLQRAAGPGVRYAG